ncbi:MAG TPA: IPExxxVDY family protein [Bacteroidales bacterium]|jgi:hypothetical protein|nr:IPExxxVDY family protein [Bacteroidales bacterium]MDI9574609.1 IPExxxVDY family protein [Bacteroidota bacterium]OQC59522.1 MAG: hypothetical protein BWX51_01497 [Bacteroidetes bacterium ADurb.Bin012]MBP9512115.1 IPExxxVDY family protein [Bacteroidales bacterium]MBP9588646.1 IPExxxVDY family protein [Bacteroidales bacterium]
MPKTLIESELNENYRIYSLSTDLPDYKLCYSLNRQLKWDFRRRSHLHLTFVKKNSPRQFSLFQYELDQFARFFLLYPFSEQIIVLPNCFFILQGCIHLSTEQKILETIRWIDGIHSFYFIDIQNPNASSAIHDFFDSLIYDLEYHLLQLDVSRAANAMIRY